MIAVLAIGIIAGSLALAFYSLADSLSHPRIRSALRGQPQPLIVENAL